MGLNILQNLKRVGLALTLIATSAFATAEDQSGTVVQWGRTSVASSTPDVLACGSSGVTNGDFYPSDNSVLLMKDGTVRLNDQPTGLTGITAISVGFQGALALRSDGTVAEIDLTTRTISNKVPSGLHGVVSINAGYYGFMAVKADGSVVAWDIEGNIKSGMPAADPVNPVVKAVEGIEARLFLRKDGTVTGEGNWYSTGDDAPLVVPTGLKDVIDISIGAKGALALKSDHTILCFGTEANEAQGKFSGGNYVAIACGLFYSMAIQDDGSSRSLKFFCLPQLYLSNSEIITVPPGLTPLAIGGGISSYTPMVIVPGFDGRLTLNGTALVGGTSQRLTATLTLNAPAPEDRYIDCLSPSLIQASFVIPKGKRAATFYVYGYDTDRPTPASLFIDGYFVGWANVYPNLITNIRLNPSSVEGGQTATGTVTLSAPTAGGLGLNLYSDNPNVNPGNGYCGIPAGSRTGTFTIRTSAVTATTQAKITATYGILALSSTMTLQPRPVVKSVTLASTLFGNQKITGTVALAIPAASAGATVTVAGDGLAVGSTITIPAGSKTGAFTVTADDPSVSTVHHLTFSTATSSIGKDVTVKPNLLASVTLSTSSGQGGTPVTGTVTLSKPVDVDTVVNLDSAKPGVASVPATVTVPAGSSSVNFTITTVARATGNVVVTATKGGSVKKVILAVTK